MKINGKQLQQVRRPCWCIVRGNKFIHLCNMLKKTWPRYGQAMVGGAEERDRKERDREEGGERREERGGLQRGSKVDSSLTSRYGSLQLWINSVTSIQSVRFLCEEALSVLAW